MIEENKVRETYQNALKTDLVIHHINGGSIEFRADEKRH